MASHYASKSFHTKGQANKWARATEIQIQNGEFESSNALANAPKLKDVIGDYQRKFTSHKKSAVNERYAFNILLKHKIVEKPIADITPREIKALRDSMLKDYENTGSVRRYLSTLRHVFTKALKEWELISSNPFDSVELPKAGGARTRRLVDNEFELLASQALKHRNSEIYSILVLAVETAMRQGEILKLRWSDLDTMGRVIIARDTKNGETRGIPLSSIAFDVIQALPRVDETLFHYTVDGFKTSWSKLLKKTGIEGLNFHDLRHEATSRLFEKGLDTMEVAAITGHKDLKMLSRYTHLKAYKLVNKLDPVIKSQPKNIS